MSKINISVTIDHTIYKALKKQAMKENRNTSNMIEVMAEKYLELWMK
jgi:hypothetical protein